MNIDNCKDATKYNLATSLLIYGVLNKIVMKKLYIFLLFLPLIFSACDSVTDLQPQQNLNEAVPQVTINAIKQAFPEATKIKFSTIEKNKFWQSDFEVKVEPMSAIVSHLGEITETYKVTGEVALPENIKKYIETNYAGATIKNASQQIGKDGKGVGYKVSVPVASKIKVISLPSLLFILTL